MTVLQRLYLVLVMMVLVIRPEMAGAAVIVEQGIPPEQSVGSLKQGLACFPAGKIKAFQLRMPSVDMSEALAQSGHSWLNERKLWGVITKLDVSVCTSWKGIARTKPKGKMSIEISWSLTPPGDDAAACTTTAKISLDGEDPRVSEKPLMSAIAASLADAERCFTTA